MVAHSALARDVLLGFDWLIACMWMGRSAQWLRGLALVPDLHDARYAAPASTGNARLTVIVPARNEGKAIEACLRSLLATVEVRLEILAVDDRSTDATGAIMDDMAAEAACSSSLLECRHAMRVLHITELPAGWMGKTHAMGLAAAEATGDWLLFTDGDMLFAPDVLARALRFAELEQADHVVLYPTMIFKSFGERMMLAFLHAMSIWGPRPWKISDPEAKRDYIGVGAFNLVRRTTYDAVGGWGAQRLEVLEDLRMGFTVKRAGYRQRVVFGRDLARIRWAEGAIGVVNNMTKNLFAVFRFNVPLATLALSSIFLLCLLPFAALVFGRVAVGPYLLTMLALVALYSRYYRFGLPRVAYVLTFPAGAVLFLFALAQSISRTILQRGVTWRGTFYPLAALRKHAGPLR